MFSAKMFVTMAVLLICAKLSSCASKSEDQQKDQYAPPNKDTTSTTTTTKTNESKPLETMYGDQPSRVPLRHHRVGSKGIKKLPKRNYESLWQDPTQSLPPAYFYSSWTPATYTLNRPYFIPAWGPVGGVPIYFPPQPLLVNPGYPPRNPPPHREYLPPYENPPVPTTTPQSPPDFEISNKFGDADDAPVWDLADTPPEIGRRPPSSGGNRVPTRRPRPPNISTSTFPSVVRRPATEEANSINSLSASKENENKVVAGGSAVASAPVTNAPGRCVWAIISCCSGASQDVTNVCFEQLGCSGPFWDKSPCDSEFAKAAINAALEFYKTGK